MLHSGNDKKLFYSENDLKFVLETIVKKNWLITSDISQVLLYLILILIIRNST